MNTNDEIKKLAVRLKLPVFAEYGQVVMPELPFSDNLLSLMRLQAEKAEESRIQYQVRVSGMHTVKTFGAFEYSPQRYPYLDWTVIEELKTCSFIERKQDVVLYGPPGSGKTHAAMALAYEAIKQGYSVKFRKASDIVNELNDAKAKKQIMSCLKRLTRPALLVIDELGYLNYNVGASALLFQIISARNEMHSTIFTSNFEFSHWRTFIGEPKLATAIVDRVIFNSAILNLGGSTSWRLDCAQDKSLAEKMRRMTASHDSSDFSDDDIPF